MKRSDLIAQISATLRRRSLVWFGTRGDDVEAATELPQLSAAYSLIGRYDGRDSVDAESLERLTGKRVDLDGFELDDHLGDHAVRELRNRVLSALSGPSALFTYRPSTFLSAISFARRDRCDYLGMFKDHQTAFEHKPWVESSVAQLGIPHVPWTYIADEEQLRTLKMLARGAVMLRTSRSSGGIGLVKLEDADMLRAAWMTGVESFVSVAPYIDRAMPLNVGAVVWKDGVTLHPASVQLIGHPALTTRPFGYCGNDFALVSQLPLGVLGAVEDSTLRVGEWLRGHGYVGAFGVDFLVKDGVPLFTEVNPRFQGSTHASCRISVELGESCILLEHLAAHLGITAPHARPLAWWASHAAPLSHIVLHNTSSRGRLVHGSIYERLGSVSALRRVDVVAPPDVEAEPNATLARVTLGRSVTTNGFDLSPDIVDVVGAATRTSVRAPTNAVEAPEVASP